MADRRKILVHLRRLSDDFEGIVARAAGNPLHVHSACGFHLAGILAYLEGEGGVRSWNGPSGPHNDFDTFANAHPPKPKDSFASRGITCTNLDALAELRNAIVHNDGDLSKNRNANSEAMVRAANFPGVVLNGSVAQLNQPLLEYVRLAGLAVRNYLGEE